MQNDAAAWLSSSRGDHQTSLLSLACVQKLAERSSPWTKTFDTLMPVSCDDLARDWSVLPFQTSEIDELLTSLFVSSLPHRWKLAIPEGEHLELGVAFQVSLLCDGSPAL